MAIIFATATSDGAPINFPVVRGTRWTDSFQLVDQIAGVPIDLTGLTDVIMRVRSTITSPDVLLELSITNGLLQIIDAQTGQVGIDVPSLTTNTFPNTIALYGKKRARYVCDALIQRSANEYEAAISGKVIVQTSVTRKLDDA